MRSDLWLVIQNVGVYFYIFVLRVFIFSTIIAYGVYNTTSIQIADMTLDKGKSYSQRACSMFNQVAETLKKSAGTQRCYKKRNTHG